MFKQGSIQSHLSLRDKIFSVDIVLFFSILILGIISLFAMYSTDGGEFLYHTKSHIVRFFVFFILFIAVSFFKINFWYNSLNENVLVSSYVLGMVFEALNNNIFLFSFSIKTDWSHDLNGGLCSNISLSSFPFIIIRMPIDFLLQLLTLDEAGILFFKIKLTSAKSSADTDFVFDL